MGRASLCSCVVGLALGLVAFGCSNRRADMEARPAKATRPAPADSAPSACRLEKPVDPVSILAPSALILSPAYIKAKGAGSGTTIPLLGMMPGSFGEACGFRNGDALLDVNDFPVSMYPRVGADIAASVEREGEARVKVLRDGQIITIRIGLER